MMSAAEAEVIGEDGAGDGAGDGACAGDGGADGDEEERGRSAGGEGFAAAAGVFLGLFGLSKD